MREREAMTIRLQGVQSENWREDGALKGKKQRRKKGEGLRRGKDEGQRTEWENREKRKRESGRTGLPNPACNLQAHERAQLKKHKHTNRKHADIHSY